MVKIFTVAQCIQCKMTKERMRALGVKFEEVNLSDEKNASDLIRLKNENKRRMPVIETPETSWCGFQPDKIRTLA